MGGYRFAGRGDQDERCDAGQLAAGKFGTQ